MGIVTSCVHTVVMLLKELTKKLVSINPSKSSCCVSTETLAPSPCTSMIVEFGMILTAMKYILALTTFAITGKIIGSHHKQR